MNKIKVFQKLMPDRRNFLSSIMNQDVDNRDTRSLRERMIWEQLRSRGLTDETILKAFHKIPRHLFIPHVSIEEAYEDHPVSIKSGQTISQPFIVALMIQYLDLKPEHRVLEIGSGSGYATAILSLLCKEVDALEVFSELIEDSREVIHQLDLTNISFLHQSAWEQINTDTVYDRVVLWASPPRVPAHLFDILSDEQGVLVSPEGKFDQYVNIYTKRSGKIKKNRRDAVRFVPLVQGTVSEIDR